MSKRRMPGERVLVKAGAGFLAVSRSITATIQNDGDEACWLCADPLCREWATLHSDHEGTPATLYHVSECQMEDLPS